MRKNEKPKSSEKPKVRKCLKCEKDFLSESKFQRICQDCKKKEGFRGYREFAHLD